MFRKFIHDHINQVALAITFGTTLVTQNIHDTALVGLISAAAAFLLKVITPKPPVSQ